MREFVIAEREVLSAGNFKTNVRERSRLFTGHPDHLVRDIDTGYLSVERIFRQQPGSPTGSTADIEHPRIRLHAHARDRLLAHRPMSLLHAIALAGARPFIEFSAKLFVHSSGDK